MRRIEKQQRHSDFYFEFTYSPRIFEDGYDDRTDSNWSEYVADSIMDYEWKSQFISEQLLWRIVNAKTLFP